MQHDLEEKEQIGFGNNFEFNPSEKKESDSIEIYSQDQSPIEIYKGNVDQKSAKKKKNRKKKKSVMTENGIIKNSNENPYDDP